MTTINKHSFIEDDETNEYLESWEKDMCEYSEEDSEYDLLNDDDDDENLDDLELSLMMG